MYRSAFHKSRDADTSFAATRILTLIMERAPVRSVCDIGCGVGTWLRIARELGVEEIAGFEGTWLDRSLLVIDDASVVLQDLENPIRTARRYDLAICLEVAEHLSPERAPGLVADLAALSDIVLFSAAIPAQGGTGHRNEQWQSYWAGHFAKSSFDVFDVVRPVVWDDEKIPFWYRQNILVFVRVGSPAHERWTGHVPRAALLDVVHPVQWERSQPRGLFATIKYLIRRTV